jgi:prepilin-type N-terminal cleavage/methylation domain-containing protein
MRTHRRRSASSGMTLIELMIAMVVLAVGLIAIANVVALAIAHNNRNRLDTTATMLSEMVLEQIQSVPATSNVILTVTDCAGNVRNINTTGAAAPAGAGATLITSGAALNAGSIDYTQTEAAIPVGYSMDYTTCGPAGAGVTYELRWNIVNGTNAFTKIVTVSSRLRMTPGTVGATPNAVYFAPPVTLRGIAGQ